jgi:N-acyl-D-amino-acid deacylase
LGPNLRIVEIGPNLGGGVVSIDIDGLAVSPGFIDPHGHSDLVPFFDQPQPFKLLQGVTTEIVGNCGFSPAPLMPDAARDIDVVAGDLSAGVDIPAGSFGDYLDRLDAAVPANKTALVGHNTLRLSGNGTARELRDGAIEEMCRLADESFAAGAVGVSSGLIYPPGSFSETPGLVALAKVAARWHRPYATHMRRGQVPRLGVERGDRGRVAGGGSEFRSPTARAPAEPTKADPRLLLEKLHAVRVAGVDVRGDQYPYLARATTSRPYCPSRRWREASMLCARVCGRRSNAYGFGGSRRTPCTRTPASGGRSCRSTCSSRATSIKRASGRSCPAPGNAAQVVS